MIYFDNSATSGTKPLVEKLKVIHAINFLNANPGRSGHKKSIKLSQIVFDTRERLKKFFNAEDYDVIFTKNCTEALNLAIFGFLKPNDHVITTCFEHNSVLRPLEKLKERGVEVSILNCEMEDISKEIERNIKGNTKLVITTMISNVTGEMCDCESVGKICKSHKIKYLIDGAQGAGHVDIDLKRLNADMFAFAGHKGLLSLTGVGGLIKRQDLKLEPILYGGTGTNSQNLTQPIDSIEGFESGTLPVLSIISLNASLRYLEKNFSKIQKKEENLSKFVYNSLKKLNFLEIYSKENSKNVFAFNIKNMDSSAVSGMLDKDFHIATRAGLHCAPLVHKHYKTSKAGAVRVSLDYKNTKREIKKLTLALSKINNKFLKSCK